MNFVTGLDYILIMKTLFSLVVVVVAASASPSCLSYCDLFKHSGWKISRRSNCNCMTPKTNLQDGVEYGHDLKPTLFPIKSQNHEPTYRNLNKKQEYDRISLINKYFSGFGNNKPSQIKHNMIKRTSGDGDIPIKLDHNSSKTSTSKELLNDMHISESKLSDCIELYILINVRRRKNKYDANLNSNVLNKNDVNDFEINAEIKSKCGQAIEILQQSVNEIKEHQRLKTKKKNHNVIPKTASEIAYEMTVGTTPIYNNEAISTVKNTTPYEESYFKAINSTDNTAKLTSEALNDFNIYTTLKDNIPETADKYNNLKDLNDSVEVIIRYDNTNTTDMSPQNVIVSTTSTPLTNIQTATEIESDSSYKLTDGLVIEKSINRAASPETVQDKSRSTADYSDNVKEGTFKTDQFIAHNNKTMTKKNINLKENYTYRRNRYNENDVPIIRIITREYTNNTVSSVINGTELLPNSDFEEETESYNNKTDNISDAKTFKSIIESEIQSKTNDTTPAVPEEPTYENTSPIINGRLYFVYGQKKIPGYFVQTTEGLQLGLDLNRICNEWTQKENEDAPLITALCEFLKL